MERNAPQSNFECDNTDEKFSVKIEAVSEDEENSNDGKLVGLNFNGTEVYTKSPNNEAEWQLYRVMQRASLLSYYDTLLEMGGDDVQQLCDAGEAEFLEIMALVGMASKPLHVRRFQKALQEWIANPHMFQSPMRATSSSFGYPGLVHPPLPTSPASSIIYTNSPSAHYAITPIPSPSSSYQQMGEISSCSGLACVAPSSVCSSSPAPSLTPPPQLQHFPTALDEYRISRLESEAKKLADETPHLQPKIVNAKKKIANELKVVLNMSENDSGRMEKIRKFSAIYGRFDCKRQPKKPLTLHELSVNEAAAQICRFVPALLTRRDHLFKMARIVVRNSGYHYSKGRSKSCMTQADLSFPDDDYDSSSNDLNFRSNGPRRHKVDSTNSTCQEKMDCTTDVEDMGSDSDGGEDDSKSFTEESPAGNNCQNSRYRRRSYSATTEELNDDGSDIDIGISESTSQSENGKEKMTSKKIQQRSSENQVYNNNLFSQPKRKLKFLIKSDEELFRKCGASSSTSIVVTDS